MTKRPGGRGPERSGIATGTSADVAAELAGLRRSMDLLIQGLTQLADITGTHTEMLRALLSAAASPTEPEDNIARLLERVVSGLDAQRASLRTIGDGMTNLPADIGKAVGGRMAAALVGNR